MFIKYGHSIWILIVLFIANLKQCISSSHSISDKNDFDVLIFTQRWPVSGCIAWMETGPKHSCILPSPHEMWIIHGIWPTKFDTVGPLFCNDSATFDVHELAPFEFQLSEFWMNIEQGKGMASLWKHEWLKHGTCSAQLTELDSERKYFGQGLSWLQQYSMSLVLQTNDIRTDSRYTISDIHRAVVNGLGHKPAIHCYYDKKQDTFYLDEIRICFNKTLQLIDCDHIVDADERILLSSIDGSEIITNCDETKSIEYPSVVPSDRLPQQQQKSAWKFPYVNVYKLILLLQWFTL